MPPNKHNTRLTNSIVDYALTGGSAHVATRTVFDGLDWKTAGKRVKGSPHTLYQLLNHMSFWQDGVLLWLDGGSPSMPEHASDSWPSPTAPKSATAWAKAVRQFRTGLARLEQAAGNAKRKRRRKSPFQMLVAVAVHNSYHAGQAALLRQLLGKWPPPSGGLTW
jgi:uncharacterized damage-inducible protein DinB